MLKFQTKNLRQRKGVRFLPLSLLAWMHAPVLIECIVWCHKSKSQNPFKRCPIPLMVTSSIINNINYQNYQSSKLYLSPAFNVLSMQTKPFKKHYNLLMKCKFMCSIKLTLTSTNDKLGVLLY